MNFEDVKGFLQTHHRGVVMTMQPNGSVQSSIVVCGTYGDDLALVAVNGKSQKVKNLRRDARCTVLAVTGDWRSYATVEGNVTLKDYSNTDGEEMRVLLREVYRACGDSDHPDWDEYDDAMQKQEAVVILLRPSQVYGLLR